MFILSLFILACTQISAGEQVHNQALQPVAHTNYANTHKHGALRIEPVTDPDALPFKALFQLYEFEFAARTYKEVTPNGLYQQDAWSGHGVDIYLLYCDQTPIGFAIVNLGSMITGEPNTKDIAEFFIMPSHRRQGNGLWLAHAIFSRYPGQWEVRQIAHHVIIRNFWRKAIQLYVGEQFTDQDLACQAWVGPVQTFNTASQITNASLTPKETTECHDNSKSQFSYILKASPEKGIGVFTLHDIVAGSSISERPRFKIRLCKSSEIPAELKGHCTHLANDTAIAPHRFDRMPIFWYLNHSDQPNVAIPNGISVIDDKWLVMQMYALRDIKAGEELCINYNDLGEPNELKEAFYRA